MSKKTKAEKPKDVKETKSRKPATKNARLKVIREAKPAVPAFDFIGRVESIRVKGSASGLEFEFALHGRKGTHQSFRLNAAHAATVMANVVIAAHDKGAKIGVRSEKGGEGLPVAAEIVWRPRLGKGA